MPPFELRLRGWLDRQQGDPLDRATFAELEIWVEGVCLTEVYDAGARSTRQAIRVATAPLALWWMWNQWRILHEREGRRGVGHALAHSLPAVGGGYLWPPLNLAGDGERLHVRQSRDRNVDAPVVFRNVVDTRVPHAEVQAAFDGLVEDTCARLGALDVFASPVQVLHRQLQAEGADPELRALRRAEALLGLDPEEVDPEAVRALRQAALWMGEDAADEVLGDAGFQDAPERLEYLANAVRAPQDHLDLRALWAYRRTAGEGAHLEPWQRGAELARRVRQGLGVGPDQPLDLRPFGAAAGTRRADPITAGLRGDDPQRPGVVLRPKREESRRFALARVIGDALMAGPEDRVLPVTELRSARQKAQRAFAQELLCPIEGLKQRLALPEPGEVELEDAAAHYGVSEWTVRSALVNRGLVDRELLPDSGG